MKKKFIQKLIDILERCLSKLGRYKHLKDLLEYLEVEYLEKDTEKSQKVVGLIQYCNMIINKKIQKCLLYIQLISQKISEKEIELFGGEKDLSADYEGLLQKHFMAFQTMVKSLNLEKIKAEVQEYNKRIQKDIQTVLEENRKYRVALGICTQKNKDLLSKS